ncbi:MAG TPA: DNA primase, partial [Edaphobacter sp.]|nr:DNA primase [Edaphobacter sp.]
APAPENPLDAAPDQPSRVLLARALEQPDAENLQTAQLSLIQQVEGALHALEYRYLQRRQRELRALIAEAERRGDNAMLTNLLGERVQLDRRLREH